MKSLIRIALLAIFMALVLGCEDQSHDSPFPGQTKSSAPASVRSGGSSNPTKRALLIGIDKYQDSEIRDLKGAVSIEGLTISLMGSGDMS